MGGGVSHIHFWGCHGCDRMVVWLQLSVQSVPITTKVVSSNPMYCEEYSTTLCDKVCKWLAAGVTI